MTIVSLKYQPPQDIPEISLPLSKSMVSRELIIKYIAREKFEDVECDCEDTINLRKALFQLRENVISHETTNIDIGSGATQLRLFLALCACTPDADVIITCSPQLEKRPLSPLINALRESGAEIDCLAEDGYSPLHVKGRKLPGGPIDISAEISSQFITALLLTAPLRTSALQLIISGKSVSTPYIDMTAKMMEVAGAEIRRNSDGFSVRPGVYSGANSLKSEPDWSAASYFYEFSFLSQLPELKIKNLIPTEQSLQGDANCEKLYAFLGVETLYGPNGSARLKCNPMVQRALEKNQEPIILNFSKYPDLTPAVAVSLCLASIKFEITGIGHLRYKESNRINSLANEFDKIGFHVLHLADKIEWRGKRLPFEEGETISTYGDHRIAMAFAMAATKQRLSIEDPAVVGKSFPLFWKKLSQLGIQTTFHHPRNSGKWRHLR